MAAQLNGCIFLIEDEKLLKKHNNIWTKVNNSMKNNLIANLFTIKNSEKHKKKSYSNETKDFHDEEIPFYSLKRTKLLSSRVFKRM